MGSPMNDCVFLESCPTLRSIEMKAVDGLKSFGFARLNLNVLESLSLHACPSLQSVHVPWNAQRLDIQRCSLSSLAWSTCRADTDTDSNYPRVHFMKVAHGHYTLAPRLD